MKPTLSRSRVLALLLTLFVSPVLMLRAASPAPIGWDAVPGILARIKAPQFPARDFAITDFGAKGDGVTDCTAAIRKAIAAWDPLESTCRHASLSIL